MLRSHRHYALRATLRASAVDTLQRVAIPQHRPYRAGRSKAAAGHPSQSFTFYIGMVNGGVWKTTDAGRTWKPIFEDQPTGSIGWISVAPSKPNALHVGFGEGLPGLT